MNQLLPKMTALRLPPLHQPQKSMLLSAEEYRYFKLFCDRTSKQLSGCFPSDLWSHIVLQTSETEPSVRHAVVAIGALDMTSSAIQTIRSNLGLEWMHHAHSSIVRAKNHHDLAFQQYGKALRHMTTAESTGSQSLRTRLICILLTICFETFHGDQRNASLQAQAGIRMILSSKIGLQTHSASKYTGPEIIEAELRDVFGRLDNTIVTSQDDQYSEYREKLRAHELALLEAMPQRFTSVKEGRSHLSMIINRMMYRKVTPGESKPNETALTTFVTYKDEAKDDFILRAGSFSIDRLKSESARVGEFLDRWKKAFDISGLMVPPKEPETSKDFLSAVALKLLHLSTQIRLTAGLITTQVSLDRYLPEFKEMIYLGGLLLKNSDGISGNARFTFDSIYVVPIYIAARACRDPFLRRQAIALLMTSPRKEGVWDSAMAGKVAEWAMTVEEEYMVDGFIPEHARVFGLEVVFSLKNITSHSNCWQRTPDGQPIQRTHDYVW
jgi:hypothetical protein